jgi:hypothetical protein
MAFDGSWDAYMFSTGKLKLPFRDQHRLISNTFGNR